jgi:PncC family amidohydrolase
MKAGYSVTVIVGVDEGEVIAKLENHPLIAGRYSILAERNTVKVFFSGDPDNIRAAENALTSVFPDSVLPLGTDRTGQAVIARIASRGFKVSTAESCTGGLLSGALTETPGSSDVFPGGLICYSNEAKVRLLAVPPGVIEEHGAVSEECALYMARGARSLFGTDMACSVTGIAGPGGATPGKPVGLVWFSVVSPSGERTFSKHFDGSRSEIRLWSVETALEAIWRSDGGKNDA